MPEAVCVECGKTFQFVRGNAADKTRGGKLPECCGQLRCRMAHGYTDEDWEGKARMARARQGVKTIERGRLLDVVETSQTTSKPIYEQVLVDATPDPLDEEALRRAR